MKVDNKYEIRYFPMQVDVHPIWRKFMNREDVLAGIERVRSSIAYMSKYAPHKLNKEDMEFMEKPLAELEIAMRKIERIPSSFNFSEEEVNEIRETYKNFREKIEQINLQRISW